MTEMTELEKARAIISEADAEMAGLFEKRMEAVKMVAEYKKSHGLQVFDASREQAVIAGGAARMKNEEFRPYYVSYLQSVMDISKSYQHRLLDGMRIAYSGVKGAFAEVAAKKIFPDGVTVPYPDFASAYKAVTDGECDCALLPVENSYNGDVGQVMDLAFFGSLHINGIYDAGVVQNLLTLPGVTLDEIREVVSHPQALGQCSEFIRRHNWKQTKEVNTAVAARAVAESGRRDLAAIGSEEAADEYGLVTLVPHIEEDRGNTTRFAVFSRSPKSPSPDDNRFVMTFTVNNEAGSLGRAVSVIGYNGFNLRALKSRPTKELKWDYYFYAEGEGNIHSSDGEQMLRELALCCNNVSVIGSFEKEMPI